VGAEIVIPSNGFAAVPDKVIPWPTENVIAADEDPLNVELPKKVTSPAEHNIVTLTTFWL
jgi:hypothetical protein